MKKHLDYLFLLAPALVWWLSSQLLGDQFHMPNRLMLAVLCTAAGAGAMLTHRKVPGLLALVAGLAMLASVPVEHEIPASMLTLRISGYDISKQSTTTQARTIRNFADSDADWIAYKTSGPANDAVPHCSPNHPYRYTSCAGHRNLISRHPLSSVQESQVMGAAQLKGQIQAGDTTVGFVVIDLSGTTNEADARDLISEALQPATEATVALIDTGKTGLRIPLEWITHTTGFCKSQRPWTSFSGSFELTRESPSQILLFSPALRCKGFAQPVSDTPSIEATYAVGT